MHPYPGSGPNLSQGPSASHLRDLGCDAPEHGYDTPTGKSWRTLNLSQFGDFVNELIHAKWLMLAGIIVGCSLEL